jgi:predicted outer membrane repeat protein
MKTTISGNQTTATSAANLGGGGIFIAGSGLTTPQPVGISSSTIGDNRSAYNGGGLLALNGIALTISGTTFAGNQSAHDGGGLMSGGTGKNKVDIAITGSTFANNFSNAHGGGIFAEGDGRLSVTTTKVIGNVANLNGGGIALEGLAANNGVVLKNLTVSGNSCGDIGGGVEIDSTADFHVIGGSFTDNQAGSGGGIAVFGSGGSILGASIERNAAAVGGGVNQSGPGTVTLQIAKVHGNTAPTDPDVFGAFTFV